MVSDMFRHAVERACSTEPSSEDARRAACDEIVAAISAGNLTVLDLAVLLAVSLTSPEKEAREHGTRLLGEVVSRCRSVLGEGELHTLAEFLAARLKDWPCVGAAAAACRALLQDEANFEAPLGALGAGEASGDGPDAFPGSGRVAGRLRDDSALLVLQSAAEVLRSAQSFRQEERSALLQLLLAAARGSWGRLAASRGVDLLDCFLGAADGEKDPRCLLLAFEAVKALCGLYHDPRVDPAPLRQLADEVVDWASSYFPVSFNPPPSLARGPGAITRAQLAGQLEAALAASPFLAAGVLPLLVEKLSSTYRPAKEDALSALRRCCQQFGAEAVAEHSGQLWPALRGEILAPSSSAGTAGAGGGLGVTAGPAGGEAVDAQEALAAAAASCLTVVVRAAGPGSLDAMALKDPFVADLLSIARSGGSATHGSGAQQRSRIARADRQVLCGAAALAAVCAAGPPFLLQAHGSVLAELEALLRASLAAASGPYDSADQTLYCTAVLTAVVDAVAADMTSTDPPAAGWTGPGSSSGLTALAGVKAALIQALYAVHARISSAAGSGGVTNGSADVEMAQAPEAEAEAGAPAQPPADVAAVATGAGVTSIAEGVSPAAVGELCLAMAGAWQALLRLHAAAAAAAASGASDLTLSPTELAAAAEQLCELALGGPSGSPSASEQGGAGAQAPGRLLWGGHRQQEATSVEAAAAAAAEALQLLLQLSPVRPGADATPSPTPSTAPSPLPVPVPASLAAGGAPAVLSLVVGKLVAAMVPAGGDPRNVAADASSAAAAPAVAAAAASGSGHEDKGRGRRVAALALALAVQLASPAWEGEAARGAHGGIRIGGGGGGGAAVVAAELLEALRPVLLGLRGTAVADEEWLRNCLRELAHSVLPHLAQNGGTPQSAAAYASTPHAAAASAAPEGGPCDAAAAQRAAVACAAHKLAAAALAAAAEWEAAGAAGLPFAGRSDGLPGESGESLPEAWCAAVQGLVACCEWQQQLDLALDAAEYMSTCLAAVTGTTTSAAGTPAASGAHVAIRLPLASAIVAGLRPGVLAANSSAALADGLLRLFAAAGTRRRINVDPPGGTNPPPQRPPHATGHALSTAAVALTATVNRWQDAGALDSWLQTAFRPAVLQPLGLLGHLTEQPSGAQADGAAAAAGPETAAAVPKATVLAVGWLGRALALRNHPALSEVLQALVQCLNFGSCCGTAPASEAGPGPGPHDVAEGASGSGEGMMEVDGAPPAPATEARASPAGMAEVEVEAEAALQAAEAFGVLVADSPSCGGLCLPARPGVVVCRVLWQQRTYSLCVQALADYWRLHASEPGIGGGDTDPVLAAVALARLAGAAPRALSRQDAGRLAPLLVGSTRALSQALGGSTSGPAAPSTFGAAAAARAAVLPAACSALRDALGVVLDWLQQQKAQPTAQLGQALQDHVSELVDCFCAASAVGGTPPPRPTAVPPGGVEPQQATSPPPVLAAGLSAAVREEALQCCTALMDAVPYHVLHPLRSQILACIVRALDDNRRSVRQLAVRARRVWGDR